MTTFSYYNVVQGTYGVSFNWSSDYSTLTIGWTNTSSPSTASTGTTPSTAHMAKLSFGSSTDSAFVEMAMYFDTSTGSLLPITNTLGEWIDSGDTVYLSPPYMSGTGTFGYTATVSNGSYIYRKNRSRNLTGPQITIPLNNLVYGAGSSGSFRNFGNPPSSGSSSTGSTSWETKSIFGGTSGSPEGGYWAVQLTNSGTDYYGLNNIGSTHHLYSEITASRTSSNTIDNLGVMVNDSNDELEISWFRNAYSGAPTPDANTIATIYFAAPGGTAGAFPIGDTYFSSGGSLNSNWSANASYATDIKIVVDFSDNSYDIYRNSNVGGSPTWVAVDRAYLSNQEVS